MGIHWLGILLCVATPNLASSPAFENCDGYLWETPEGAWELDCEIDPCPVEGEPDKDCLSTQENHVPQAGLTVEYKCSCDPFGLVEGDNCCHEYQKFVYIDLEPGLLLAYRTSGAHGSCNYWGSCGPTIAPPCAVRYLPGNPDRKEAYCPAPPA